jgi:hypothetical protein
MTHLESIIRDHQTLPLYQDQFPDRIPFLPRCLPGRFRRLSQVLRSDKGLEWQF